MHVANCYNKVFSISCEMNADQSLFVLDLNKRRSDSTNLVWSIGRVFSDTVLENTQNIWFH